jgi:hypothetical protein
MEFTILVEDFLLYIAIHLVFLKNMYFREDFVFKKLVYFDTFYPAPKTPGRGVGAGNLKFIN